jgi:porin
MAQFRGTQTMIPSMQKFKLSGLGWTHWIACLSIGTAILSFNPQSAVAQSQDPVAIFERAEQLEEKGIDTHFGPSCIDRLFDPSRCIDAKLEACGGPTFFGLYSPMWQVGTQGGPQNNMLSQSLVLYSEWELSHETGNEGTLYALFGHESEMLGTTAGEFAGSIGTSILPNDDVGNAVTGLGHLAWHQKLCGGRIEFSVGQLLLAATLDQNDYAGWDRTSFAAEPLAKNPVRNFPLAGLGIDAAINVTDQFQLTFVLIDADGYPFHPDLKSFGRRFAYIPGIIYKPTIEGLGKGRYEFNFSHTERTERFNPGQSSSVWLFSANQELSPRLAAFSRFGTGDGRRTTIQQSLVAGLVFTQAFGFNNDWLGLGFIWNDPSDGNRSDDFGMETFWRLQLTENIQLTPDLQLYFDPSNSSNGNTEAAFGLRLAMEF